MINAKKNVKAKDYGCLLIAILSNKSVYPLIEEEYEKNKKEYDKLILKSDFFEHDKYKIIPEDIKELSAKLTGIFLSKDGNNFLRKILKVGWPRLYDYFKNNDCVVYEYIKQINDYGLDDLSSGYTIFIIKLMADMFNKEIIHLKEESELEIEAYNARLSVPLESIKKEKSLKKFDREFRLVVEKINKDRSLKNRIRLDKSGNLCKGLLFNDLLFYRFMGFWTGLQS